MIVVPSSFSFLNISMISLPWLECRLPVGSSARMILGFAIMARARPTRCYFSTLTNLIIGDRILSLVLLLAKRKDRFHANGPPRRQIAGGNSDNRKNER